MRSTSSFPLGRFVAIVVKTLGGPVAVVAAPYVFVANAGNRVINRRIAQCAIKAAKHSD